MNGVVTNLWAVVLLLIKLCYHFVIVMVPDILSKMSRCPSSTRFIWNQKTASKIDEKKVQDKFAEAMFDRFAFHDLISNSNSSKLNESR